jgi:hypothetical protein
VNLLDMGTECRGSASTENVYEGRDPATGEIGWTATAADLVCRSNSQQRAIAEVYAVADAKEKVVRDFVAAWNEVMNLDGSTPVIPMPGSVAHRPTPTPVGAPWPSIAPRPPRGAGRHTAATSTADWHPASP